MSKSVSASNLTPGAWSARWGAWLISLRTVGESWHVRIYSYVRGVARVQIAKRGVFATSIDAVAWACEVLREHGAIVFIDGQVQPLERFLAFEHAPGEIVCS